MNDYQDPQDARRCVALVDRLLDVEERVHTLVRDNMELRRDLSAGQSHRATSGTSFDVARSAHEWPLADNASLLPENLDLYDRRCDDDVVVAGRIGAEFFGQIDQFQAEAQIRAAKNRA